MIEEFVFLFLMHKKPTCSYRTKIFGISTTFFGAYSCRWLSFYLKFMSFDSFKHANLIILFPEVLKSLIQNGLWVAFQRAIYFLWLDQKESRFLKMILLCGKLIIRRFIFISQTLLFSVFLFIELISQQTFKLTFNLVDGQVRLCMNRPCCPPRGLPIWVNDWQVVPILIIQLAEQNTNILIAFTCFQTGLFVDWGYYLFLGLAKFFQFPSNFVNLLFPSLLFGIVVQGNHTVEIARGLPIF